MTWDDKAKMVTLFNQGRLQEAIDFFAAESDWDTQACDMFITGMDLTKCELCKPLDERIQKIEAATMPDFRTKLRWGFLQVELDELMGRKPSE